MAVTVRSVGISPGASGTDCVIVKPVGLTVGDLMIAQVTFRDGGAVVPEDGWVEIRADSADGRSFVSTLLWKIADSDDAAATNFTFTSTLAANIGAIIAIETGTFDTGTPINANNGQGNIQSWTATSPEITPSVADCLIILFAGANDDVTYSNYSIVDDDPGGWTEAYDIKTTAGSDGSCGAAYVIRPETTATGNGTVSLSGNEYNTGQLLAIAPAAEAPPTKRYIPHCGPRKKRTEFFPTLSMGG